MRASSGPNRAASAVVPAKDRASAPLRIALVTSSYNYIADGVALTLNRLVGYLERQGVEVLVFTPTARKPAFVHSGTILPVPSMPLPGRPEYRLVLNMPGRVKRKLLDFAPDIIHVAVPDLLGHAALTLANAHGIPAVATYHTRYETYLRHYWYLAPFEGLLTKILRRFYGACREVYVPSESTRDALLADGLKDNFKPWPRGIETDRFNPARRSAAWRARHGIAEDELIVLHVSRLVREKRLDMLAAALNKITAPHRVVIVGDGPDRGFVESQLPHAIFTGFLDGDELATAYASSDIFFFPSDSESFGNVTLEAMASGLACVCADATGSRSLVVDGQTGLLAPAGDAAAFARHIAALAMDVSLRHRMGQAARARALGFSWDETLARMLGYYRALLAGTTAP
ncbi:MAG: glycosyltransferase family 1 protein [Alphaproteobacteria bacterium]|nr:glycosyltransferase family 1 protein [Alphaproteobacteria bacterium]